MNRSIILDHPDLHLDHDDRIKKVKKRIDDFLVSIPTRSPNIHFNTHPHEYGNNHFSCLPFKSYFNLRPIDATLFRDSNLNSFTLRYHSQALACRQYRQVVSIMGHLNAVYCVLFDRTGRRFITGGDDYLVKMWSTRRACLLQTLRGHADVITDMVINPENTLLATGSGDKTVRIWDLATGTPIAVLAGHQNSITTVQFSPMTDGEWRFLLSSSYDGTCRLWPYNAITNHFPNPRPLNEVSSSDTATTNSPSWPSLTLSCRLTTRDQVRFATFSRGGTFVAAAGTDGYIRVFDISSVTESPTEKEHHQQRMSTRGLTTRGLTSDTEMPINSIADSTTSLLSMCIDAHNGYVTLLQFNPQQHSQALLSCSLDGTVKIWRPHSSSSSSSSISSSVSSNSSTSEWTPFVLDMNSNNNNNGSNHPCRKEEEQGSGTLENQNNGTSYPQQSWILPSSIRRRATMLQWASDGLSVVTAVSDHTLRVWDASSGALLHVLRGHTKSVYVLDCHPQDSNIVLSAGYDGRVFLWDVRHGKCLQQFETDLQRQFLDGRFSEDGQFFLLTDHVGACTLFSLDYFPDVYRQAPYEQFFPNDYNELVRDERTFSVLDAQTQLPPHCLPRQLLCDSLFHVYGSQNLLPESDLLPSNSSPSSRVQLSNDQLEEEHAKARDLRQRELLLEGRSRRGQSFHGTMTSFIPPNLTCVSQRRRRIGQFYGSEAEEEEGGLGGGLGEDGVISNNTNVVAGLVVVIDNAMAGNIARRSAAAQALATANAPTLLDDIDAYVSADDVMDDDFILGEDDDDEEEEEEDIDDASLTDTSDTDSGNTSEGFGVDRRRRPVRRTVRESTHLHAQLVARRRLPSRQAGRNAHRRLSHHQTSRHQTSHPNFHRRRRRRVIADTSSSEDSVDTEEQEEKEESTPESTPESTGESDNWSGKESTSAISEESLSAISEESDDDFDNQTSRPSTSIRRTDRSTSRSTNRSKNRRRKQSKRNIPVKQQQHQPKANGSLLPEEWVMAVEQYPTPYFPQIGDEVAYFRQGHEQFLRGLKGSYSTPWQSVPALPAVVMARVVNVDWLLDAEQPSRHWCEVRLAVIADAEVEKAFSQEKARLARLTSLRHGKYPESFTTTIANNNNNSHWKDATK